MPDTLDLALVTDFPPNTGNLAEYGHHLADAYAARDDVSLAVLASEHDDMPAADPDYQVVRCWKHDRLRSAVTLLSRLRAGDYDAIHFNLQTTWFGERYHNRFAGLALPALAIALTNAHVVTTLHDSLDFVDASALPEQIGPVKRLAATVATQLALCSHDTTVTAPAFRDRFDAKYPFGTVHHVPHGTFTPMPAFTPPPTVPFRLLLFGHVGPHKDYETVLRAFATLRSIHPEAELVIAGGAHPQHADVKADLEARYGDWPGVEFRGYVPENAVRDLFEDASVVVLPYATSTGVSGVHHLAMRHGRPVVAYDSDLMTISTVQCGGLVEFVPPGAPDVLARTLAGLADDADRLNRLGRWNHRAAERSPIPTIVDAFLDLVRDADRPTTNEAPAPTPAHPTTAAEGLDD